MLDSAWLSRRKALHERYSEVGRVGDASRLAYLHGAERSWTEEEVAAMWDRAVNSPLRRPESLNCVYVHVPFCKSICSFCNYDRLQPSSPALLKTWLARVLRSLEVIGPAVRPLTFQALYLGGGTPSVLPARMLHELLEGLAKHLRWDPRASRKLEFDPAVMNRERLEVLAAHDIRQLSFGIETLDPEVNARHNRGRQGIEMIERCFDDMRDLRITDVACDFLLGLEGTTAEGMLGQMETVLSRFRPRSLDIFMLTPTHSYVQRHFGGSFDAFWKHLSRFEELVPAALPGLAARTGYEVRVGFGHHMMLVRRDTTFERIKERVRRLLSFGARKPEPPLWSYTALTTESRCPLNVLGLGRSARSSIFGTAAFAAHDPDDNPSREGPAYYVGNTLDMADEARSFLSHFLRDNDVVERDEFRRIFGGDMPEIIPAALAGWEHEGTALLEDAVLRFVRQDRRARIRSLLWLVPEEAIEFDLGHFDQLELTPAGVARLAAPIEAGTALAGGFTFEGTESARLLVRTPAGETVRMRVAPELSAGAPLRLLADEPPGSENNGGMDYAMAQLATALTRLHTKARKRGAGASGVR